jgi:2-oxoglutarate ferredoxin oxidoreductase subunit alpha
MAERYQTPVIVLGDQHFNDSYFTVDQLDLGQIKIDRGSIASGDAIPSVKDYRRYAWHDSGISPRILPGQSRAVLYADSDEHTEAGHITEDAEVRKRMVLKRMRKLEGMRHEMKQPEAYPSSNSNTVLIGWGSTYGAMKEAVDLLNREGLQAKMLHFSEIYPFPSKDFAREIKENATFFAIENNYGGQFADLFSFETGISVSHKILKYDGRPFSPGEIVAQVKKSI